MEEPQAFKALLTSTWGYAVKNMVYWTLVIISTIRIHYYNNRAASLIPDLLQERYVNLSLSAYERRALIIWDVVPLSNISLENRAMHICLVSEESHIHVFFNVLSESLQHHS